MIDSVVIKPGFTISVCVHRAIFSGFGFGFDSGLGSGLGCLRMGGNLGKKSLKYKNRI